MFIYLFSILLVICFILGIVLSIEKIKNWRYDGSVSKVRKER